MRETGTAGRSARPRGLRRCVVVSRRESGSDASYKGPSTHTEPTPAQIAPTSFPPPIAAAACGSTSAAGHPGGRVRRYVRHPNLRCDRSCFHRREKQPGKHPKPERSSMMPTRDLDPEAGRRRSYPPHQSPSKPCHGAAHVAFRLPSFRQPRTLAGHPQKLADLAAGQSP